MKILDILLFCVSFVDIILGTLFLDLNLILVGLLGLTVGVLI